MLQPAGTCYSCRSSKYVLTALTPPPQASPPPQMEVLPLTPEHIADVTRLHRFSSSAAGSVFGTRDMTEVLAAAAAGSDG